MKKKSLKKLSYEELSTERKLFCDVLKYVLERVYDPYVSDEFFRSDSATGSYFFKVLKSNLELL